MEPNAIRNLPLERAMDEVARHDNPQTRRALYAALLASTLIVAGRVGGEGNSQVAFNTLESPPGYVILPAFTDHEALLSFASTEMPWLAIGAQALFQSIAAGNIAEVRVNPFAAGQTPTKPGGIVTRQEFAALAQGLLPEKSAGGNVARMTVAAGQQISVGQCTNEPPAELLAKVRDRLQNMSEIRNAFLFEIINGGQKSSVVGLEFTSPADAATVNRVMGEIGSVLRGQMAAGAFLDFMPLGAGPLLEAVRKCGRVVFHRP